MKCSYMLASGGDDNAIMVHTFQIHGLPASVDVRSRGTSVGAHTSQITGCTEKSSIMFRYSTVFKTMLYEQYTDLTYAWNIL